MGAPIIFSSSVAERVQGEREREGETEKGRERDRDVGEGGGARKTCVEISRGFSKQLLRNL